MHEFVHQSFASSLTLPCRLSGSCFKGQASRLSVSAGIGNNFAQRQRSARSLVGSRKQSACPMLMV